MSDKYYDDRVTEKVSGEDDLEDLATNGKGLVVTNDGSGEVGPSWTSNRLLCTNCRKGIHNTPKNENKCRGRKANCECRCQTHYVGRDGKTRPYGTPDDSFQKEEMHFDPSSDALIEQLNKRWHEINHTTPQKPQTKPKTL